MFNLNFLFIENTFHPKIFLRFDNRLFMAQKRIASEEEQGKMERSWKKKEERPQTKEQQIMKEEKEINEEREKNYQEEMERMRKERVQGVRAKNLTKGQIGIRNTIRCRFRAQRARDARAATDDNYRRKDKQRLEPDRQPGKEAGSRISKAQSSKLTGEQKKFQRTIKTQVDRRFREETQAQQLRVWKRRSKIKLPRKNNDQNSQGANETSQSNITEEG